ncbi:hypothetical protein [Nocardiopsis chromatogenes]|nr:hypothetical protein [Nocardiopsis chromatogenes]
MRWATYVTATGEDRIGAVDDGPIRPAAPGPAPDRTAPMAPMAERGLR